MRFGRVLTGGVALVALAAGAASCSSSKTTTTGAGKPLIGVDYPRSDTDFWNSYIRYVPQFAGQLGVDLKTTNSQNDVANLIANVQTFISQGVKGVVMAPQDTAAVAPSLATLQAKKMPVVTIDTRPDTGNVFMVVRADNRAYGTKACQFLGVPGRDRRPGHPSRWRATAGSPGAGRSARLPRPRSRVGSVPRTAPAVRGVATRCRPPASRL